MKDNQIFLSPRKYILTRAKKLPRVECLVDKHYKDLGITNVIVARQEGGGKYTVGVFCVDLYCLGVKNAFCNCHLNKEDYHKLSSSFERGAMKVTAAFAHNLIYGAIDYAAEFGFKPHRDFAFAENVLDDSLIDEGIDKIEFGVNGKPHYIEAPNDDVGKIMAQLSKHL
jgi:hypothetical protein